MAKGAKAVPSAGKKKATLRLKAGLIIKKDGKKRVVARAEAKEPQRVRKMQEARSCYLNEMVEYMEEKTGIDIAKRDLADTVRYIGLFINYKKELARIRNEELFPFVKDHATVEEGTHKLVLSEADAFGFLRILIKIVPEVAPYAGPSLTQTFKKWHKVRVKIVFYSLDAPCEQGRVQTWR